MNSYSTTALGIPCTTHCRQTLGAGQSYNLAHMKAATSVPGQSLYQHLGDQMGAIETKWTTIK